MALAPTIERGLNPLNPENYKPGNYERIIKGLHLIGPIVRSDYSVHDDFAIDPDTPHPTDEIGGPAHFVVGLELTEELLKNPNLSSAHGGSGVIPLPQTADGRTINEFAPPGTDPEIRGIVERVVNYGFLLTMDGPDHDDVKSLVLESSELRPRSPEKNRPIDDYIDELAEETVADMRERTRAGETVDLVDVSTQYTYKIISRIIGIDMTGGDAEEKIRKFVEFSHQAFMVGDPTYPIGSMYAEGDTTLKDMFNETVGVVRRAKELAEPTDEAGGKGETLLDHISRTDFRGRFLDPNETAIGGTQEQRKKFVEYLDLGAMIFGQRFGIEGLTANEVIAARMLEVLKPAGGETTATTLTRSIHMLLNNPSQIEKLELVASDPDKMNRAVRKFVRHASAVNMIARTATEDITLEVVNADGEALVIPKDARVFFFLGAANQDPEAFYDVLHLDLDEREPMSVAFGAGDHICPGARLATNELSAFLRKLAESGLLHEIEEAQELESYISPQLHGVKKYSIRAKQAA